MATEQFTKLKNPGKVRIWHKGVTPHDVYAVDASEILEAPNSEYSAEKGKWEAPKASAKKVREVDDEVDELEDDEDDSPTIDLSKKSKKELIEFAQLNRITVATNGSVATIRKAIEAALADREDES